ncbi:hypothetical protein [Galactobacter caseinivorans]|uniref:Uncharacterized protein n=1 Tax=Galactobacter caseinivorans TaxID=2676123 RepID=A0A496PHA7_9MICC|nr:hypothetical protein [Galactobacter caseinivorans]RKW69865.1 hypothetical protein DWQ67_10330 [Galactobacter caseinivorans]
MNQNTLEIQAAIQGVRSAARQLDLPFNEYPAQPDTMPTPAKADIIAATQAALTAGKDPGTDKNIIGLITRHYLAMHIGIATVQTNNYEQDKLAHEVAEATRLLTAARPIIEESQQHLTAAKDGGIVVSNIESGFTGTAQQVLLHAQASIANARLKAATELIWWAARAQGHNLQYLSGNIACLTLADLTLAQHHGLGLGRKGDADPWLLVSNGVTLNFASDAEEVRRRWTAIHEAEEALHARILAAMPHAHNMPAGKYGEAFNLAVEGKLTYRGQRV